MTFYSGFVAIIGRPNVGKSTLMNWLVGQKIAIVSNKPQTTRHQILSIIHGEDYQIALIDTPGIHTPKSKLGTHMVKAAETAVNDVDLVLLMVSCHDRVSIPAVLENDKNDKNDKKVFLVVNKIDSIEKNKLLTLIDAYSQLYDFDEIIPISATKGENVDKLLAQIRLILPEGPPYFPADMITDQQERQIAAEIIREKALFCLREELPHGIAVEIMSMKERKNNKLVDMEATIYCDKASHKGMVIGKNGEMLKKIGTLARKELSGLLEAPVNLQLWVKVKKDWRDNDFLLRNFGYTE